MKAFILCGGLGTRLREHTESKPKPMVEIGGRPILWHIMKIYACAGITDFVLCVGYKAEMIKDYFLNYESRNSDFTITLGRDRALRVHGSHHDEDGWRVTIAETGETSMTGARVARAARYLDDGDEAFCLTYGDGVIDLDLRRVVAFHDSHPGLVTMTGVRPPSRFGELVHDRGRVTEFNEKPQVSGGLINGGFFVIDRRFLAELSPEESCVLEGAAMERCAANGQLYVYEHEGYWHCMDTYRDWLQLEREWSGGRPPWKLWP